MNYPDQWSQDQVDAFFKSVSENAAFREHVSQQSPNLEEELKKWTLMPGDAEKLAIYIKWLRVLPNTNFDMGRDLVVFYYTHFYKIKRSLERKPRGKKLCSLFTVLTQMVLQGTSTFPPHSAKLATELMNCLKTNLTGVARFEILADLINGVEGRFLRGFNADELPRKQLDLLIKSEHQRRAGSFENLYKAKEKYDGYKLRVMENEEFLKDRSILKRKFPKVFKSGRRVMRSGQGEKCGSDRPQTPGRDSVFQEAFDVFCWKWFLDGIEGDEPIVTKLSFDVTPFGTSLFIPGYWSFDPSRDIKWEQIKEVHESRGVVKRQGSAFEPNRRDLQIKEKRVLEAVEESRALGERGDRMVQRCIRMLNLPPNTDPAYIYRLIAAAKQKKERRPQ